MMPVRIVRFVGLVLIQAGALLLIDVGLTLAWQEPVSALLAARQQDRLERQFDELLADPAHGDAASAAGSPRPRGFEPREGTAFGRIEMATLERDYVMVEGTDTATLRKGPGHYPETALPGQGRTVAVAGHRTTYLAPFRTIDNLARGDAIAVTMPYGRFTYRVQRSQIVLPEETSVIRDVGYDRLVLTACHPLYSAAKRIVVFARLARAEPL